MKIPLIQNKYLLSIFSRSSRLFHHRFIFAGFVRFEFGWVCFHSLVVPVHCATVPAKRTRFLQ